VIEKNKIRDYKNMSVQKVNLMTLKYQNSPKIEEIEEKAMIYEPSPEKSELETNKRRMMSFGAAFKTDNSPMADAKFPKETVDVEMDGDRDFGMSELNFGNGKVENIGKFHNLGNFGEVEIERRKEQLSPSLMDNKETVQKQHGQRVKEPRIPRSRSMICTKARDQQKQPMEAPNNLKYPSPLPSAISGHTPSRQIYQAQTSAGGQNWDREVVRMSRGRSESNFGLMESGSRGLPSISDSQIIGELKKRISDQDRLNDPRITKEVVRAAATPQRSRFGEQSPLNRTPTRNYHHPPNPRNLTPTRAQHNQQTPNQQTINPNSQKQNIQRTLQLTPDGSKQHTLNQTPTRAQKPPTPLKFRNPQKGQYHQHQSRTNQKPNNNQHNSQKNYLNPQKSQNSFTTTKKRQNQTPSRRRGSRTRTPTKGLLPINPRIQLNFQKSKNGQNGQNGQEVIKRPPVPDYTESIRMGSGVNPHWQEMAMNASGVMKSEQYGSSSVHPAVPRIDLGRLGKEGKGRRRGQSGSKKKGGMLNPHSWKVKGN
jgi:hypothetical protein